MGHATHAIVFHHMVIVNLLSWALLLLRAKAAVSRLGAALENFPMRKRKKKFWFHVRKKKRSQKNVAKNNRGHPQNRQCPLLTMVANIHLWALFCDVNIASSRL
jgi:hypothetical protein